MPAGLPGYESTCTTTGGDHPDPGIGPSVVLTIPGIQVQFRLHDYYMGKFILFFEVYVGCPEIAWIRTHRER